MKISKDGRSEIILVSTMVAGISLFMAILLQQTGYFERSIGYISAMTISLAVAMYFAFKNESNKSDSEEINN